MALKLEEPSAAWPLCWSRLIGGNCLDTLFAAPDRPSLRYGYGFLNQQPRRIKPDNNHSATDCNISLRRTRGEAAALNVNGPARSQRARGSTDGPGNGATRRWLWLYELGGSKADGDRDQRASHQ